MLERPSFKHILVVRADNMGDVLMSGPAIRALKERFGASITMLTSRAGSGIVPFVPEIDALIVADLPWVRAGLDADGYAALVEQLRALSFDLAVIFTVYSQSALPAALLCWQAGIPARLAYSRENPYALLTHWEPDEEPYSIIRHQVERDLLLVRHIGAVVADDRLRVSFMPGAAERCAGLLAEAGVDIRRPWIVVHPGVSEAKREYPLSLWREVVEGLRLETGLQLVVTGAAKDKALAEALCVEENIHSVAGLLDMEAFIAVIAGSRLVVSVNTVAVHLCAATGVPVVVLYAMTNPQHTPWKVRSEVLPFSVDPALCSRNRVIRYVSELWSRELPVPSPEAVVAAVRGLLGEVNYPAGHRGPAAAAGPAGESVRATG
jgi:ADP-heptose:LPS heptosyltransferase